jgi:hypothetical protein
MGEPLNRDDPKANADCWQLRSMTHREAWRIVAIPYGKRRWVCPICHPGDFESSAVVGRDE